MAIKLKEHQLEALDKMHNGCILCGGVGSGKSITSLAYYYIQNGGHKSVLKGGPYRDLKCPKDLYIITTARKRDTYEWEKELARYFMEPHTTRYKNKIVIDSWNNIKKYINVEDSFFIFDEQRVVGWGAWTKAFLKIAKHNEWILLSATPGDTWNDYKPCFVANGFYRNKTEFEREHIIWSRFSKYPKIDRYVNTGRLMRLRKNTLVPMNYSKPAKSNNIDIWVDFSKTEYNRINKDRFDYEKNEPMKSASEVCFALRKSINSDPSRIIAVLELIEKHPKTIIFYNYDYELDILKDTLKQLESDDFEVAEYNGHKHQPIPETNRWVYLVQYTAGAEGWNCIKTDTIIFYSQNYSYKIMTQSSGRIDRLNTPFKDLYYYHIKSHAPMDRAISIALANKKKFNEYNFVAEMPSRENQRL